MCFTISRPCPFLKKTTLAITKCVGGNVQWPLALDGATEYVVTGQEIVTIGGAVNIPCSDGCRDSQVKLEEKSGRKIMPRSLPAPSPDPGLLEKEAVLVVDNYEHFRGAIDVNPYITRVSKKFLFRGPRLTRPKELSASGNRGPQ